jgi:hypothetical protein
LGEFSYNKGMCGPSACDLVDPPKEPTASSRPPDLGILFVHGIGQPARPLARLEKDNQRRHAATTRTIQGVLELVSDGWLSLSRYVARFGPTRQSIEQNCH